jgi:hypothetical protein
MHRRSIQEFRIDHLLEEEFACDPEFARRFLDWCGLAHKSSTVEKIVLEPKIDSSGYGDLLVVVRLERLSGERVTAALLIEDKINANAQPRQAERYLEFGASRRGVEWDDFRTVLVAPGDYVGEREKYQAFVPLERMCDWICASEPARAAFRRGKLFEAIEKRASAGPKVVDAALTAFRKAYFDYVPDFNARNGTDFACQAPRPAYDGDAWINLYSAVFPEKTYIRHRLWTSRKESTGKMEVIFENIGFSDAAALRNLREADMYLSPFGKHERLALGLDVPELRNPDSFDSVREDVDRSLVAASRLLRLYKSRKEKFDAISTAA